MADEERETQTTAEDFQPQSETEREAYQMGQMHGQSMAAAMLGRDRLSGALGESHDGQRDVYDAVGWDKNPTTQDYWDRYLMNPLGRTVVDAPAKTSWRNRPTITDDANTDQETDFESAVEDLFREHRLLERMKDADRITGIGRYGLLVIGVADGQDLQQPLGNAEEVAYFQPVAEDSVTNIRTAAQDDDTDRALGMPLEYTLDLDDDVNVVENDIGRTKVHHSRVVHIAENTLDSMLFGRPRMEPVYNYIGDAEKVMASTAEMAWRGADYGLLLQAMEGYELGDKDDLTEEAMAYYHGLQPFMRMEGIDVERLGGEEYNPSNVMAEIIKLIAGETGIPQRILTGSERGELASTQDRATWLGRISERQTFFCEPVILRPTLDKLIEAGVLPAPRGDDTDYEVEWPDLFELNDLERAEVTERMAGALSDLAGTLAMSGFVTEEEVRQEVLGWEPMVGDQAELPDDAQPRDDEPADPRDRGALPGPTDPDDIPGGAPDDDDAEDEAAQQFREMQRLVQADGGR